MRSLETGRTKRQDYASVTLDDIFTFTEKTWEKDKRLLQFCRLITIFFGGHRCEAVTTNGFLFAHTYTTDVIVDRVQYSDQAVRCYGIGRAVFFFLV